jgi:hypothetical protein
LNSALKYAINQRQPIAFADVDETLARYERLHEFRRREGELPGGIGRYHQVASERRIK